MESKAKVLLIGSGGVGTMIAYNLELGGKAEVTVVLRSNHDAVTQNGFKIESVQHGNVSGWRPTTVLKRIPQACLEVEPFDFIVVATKNIADIPPTVAELVAPAVTDGHTSIVLVQNGLNIEQPLVAKYPKNCIISGVSKIGVAEIEPGYIRHPFRDSLVISEFENKNVPREKSSLAAKRFTKLYQASGKVECCYDADVGMIRWKKLVWNSSYNSMCAVTGMDTTRMRLASFPIELLIRPVMVEIITIAEALGHIIPSPLIDEMIHVDKLGNYFKPSMLQDVEKGNFIEFENIVGEPLREAEKLGIEAPYLKMAYGLLKVLQEKIKEGKGLVNYTDFGIDLPSPPAEKELFPSPELILP